jgi:hypothetical protein
MAQQQQQLSAAEVAQAIDRAKKPTFNAYTLCVPARLRNIKHVLALTLSMEDFHKGATECSHHRTTQPNAPLGDVARTTFMPVVTQIFWEVARRLITMHRNDARPVRAYQQRLLAQQRRRAEGDLGSDSDNDDLVNAAAAFGDNNNADDDEDAGAAGRRRILAAPACEIYMEMVPAAAVLVAERAFEKAARRDPNATTETLTAIKESALQKAAQTERYTDVTYWIISYCDIDPNPILRDVVHENYERAYGMPPPSSSQSDDDNNNNDDDGSGNDDDAVPIGLAAMMQDDEAADDGANVVMADGGAVAAAAGGERAVRAQQRQQQQRRRKRRPDAQQQQQQQQKQRTAGERFDQGARDVHYFYDLYKQATSSSFLYDMMCMYAQQPLGDRETATNTSLRSAENPICATRAFSPHIAVARRSPLAVPDMRMPRIGAGGAAAASTLPGTLFTLQNRFIRESGQREGLNGRRYTPTYTLRWPRPENVMRVPRNQAHQRRMMTMVFPWTCTMDANPLASDMPQIRRVIRGGNGGVIDASRIIEDPATGALSYAHDAAVAAMRDDGDDDADGQQAAAAAAVVEPMNDAQAREDANGVLELLMSTPGMPSTMNEARELLLYGSVASRAAFDPSALLTHQNALSARLLGGVNGTMANVSITAIHQMLNILRDLEERSIPVHEAIEAAYAQEAARAVDASNTAADMAIAESKQLNVDARVVVDVVGAAQQQPLCLDYSDDALLSALQRHLEPSDVRRTLLLGPYAVWLAQYAREASERTAAVAAGCPTLTLAAALLHCEPLLSATPSAAARLCETQQAAGDAAARAAFERLDACRAYMRRWLGDAPQQTMALIVRNAGGVVQQQQQINTDAVFDAIASQRGTSAAVPMGIRNGEAMGRAVVLAIDLRRDAELSAALKTARERRIIHCRYTARQYGACARHPHSMISTVGQRVHAYRLSAADPYGTVAPSVEHPINDPAYSSFANMMMRRVQQAESVYQVSTKHRFWLVIWLGSLDATRETFDLHFNAMLLGAAASSKSYLLELLTKERIGGTTTEVSYETDKASQAGGNQNDAVSVAHELQMAMMADSKSDKTGMAARWKAQTTSMRVLVKTIVVDNSTTPPSRTQATYEGECIGVWMGSHNHDVSSMDAASRTRVHEMYFGEQWSAEGPRDTVLQSIAAQLFAERAQHSAARQRTTAEMRLIQVLIYEMDKLQAVRALKPVSMHAALATIMMFRHHIAAEGIEIRSMRFIARVLMLTRICAMLDALEKFFFLPGAPYHGEPITLSRLLLIDPVLYATSEQTAFVLSLLAPEIVNPWQDMLVAGVLGYMKDTLRQGVQPFMRRWNVAAVRVNNNNHDNHDNDNNDGRRQQQGGVAQKEVSLDAMYVALYSSSKDWPTRGAADEIHDRIRKLYPNANELPPAQTIVAMIQNLRSAAHPTPLHVFAPDPNILEGVDDVFGKPLLVPVPKPGAVAELQAVVRVDNNHVYFNYAWLIASRSNHRQIERALQATFAFRGQATRNIVLGDVLPDVPNALRTLEVGPEWRSMYERSELGAAHTRCPRIARVSQVEDSNKGDAELGFAGWPTSNDGHGERVTLPAAVAARLPLMGIPNVTYETETERLLTRGPDDRQGVVADQSAETVAFSATFINTRIDTWAAGQRAQAIFMSTEPVTPEDIARRCARAHRLPGLRPRRLYPAYGYLAGKPVLRDAHSRIGADTYRVVAPALNRSMTAALDAFRREPLATSVRRLTGRVLVAVQQQQQQQPNAAAAAEPVAPVSAEYEPARFVLTVRSKAGEPDRRVLQHVLMNMSEGEFKLLAYTDEAVALRERCQPYPPNQFICYPGSLPAKHISTVRRWQQVYDAASTEARTLVLMRERPSIFVTMEPSAAESSGETRYITARASTFGEAAQALDVYSQRFFEENAQAIAARAVEAIARVPAPALRVEPAEKRQRAQQLQRSSSSSSSGGRT